MSLYSLLVSSLNKSLCLLNASKLWMCNAVFSYFLTGFPSISAENDSAWFSYNPFFAPSSTILAYRGLSNSSFPPIIASGVNPSLSCRPWMCATEYILSFFLPAIITVSDPNVSRLSQSTAHSHSSHTPQFLQ